jgi:DNA-binding NtrC family response regulator
MRGNVLVVDDQPLSRIALANDLRDSGFEVQEASDGVQGWALFCRQAPDLVVTDLVMPKSDGLDLLSRIKSRSDVPVVLFSAHGSVQTTAAAFKAGAQDFLAADELGGEDIVERIARTLETNGSNRKNSPIYRHFSGQAESIRRLRKQLEALAPLFSPVLVLGRRGTGRDAAVRALHELGSTSGGRFQRIGSTSPLPDLSTQFPAALYLDGLEALTPKTRKDFFLRLADARRRGYGKTRRIFISSTWSADRWRSDSTFATEIGAFLLNSSVELPLVSSYREDLPEIAQMICSRTSERLNRKLHISRAGLALVAESSWVGQIRQLEQLIERAAHFSAEGQIQRDTLAAVIQENSESVARHRELRRENELTDLTRTLAQAGGNIALTARRLNRSRGAIYRMLRKYGIPLQPEAKVRKFLQD